jgi:Integrase core domain
LQLALLVEDEAGGGPSPPWLLTRIPGFEDQVDLAAAGVDVDDSDAMAAVTVLEMRRRHHVGDEKSEDGPVLTALDGGFASPQEARAQLLGSGSAGASARRLDDHGVDHVLSPADQVDSLIDRSAEDLDLESLPSKPVFGARFERDAGGVAGGGKGGALRTGWERVHVCVDDATRLAYVEVLPDERATTAIGFLRRALAFYRSYGIEVERLMTDNGSAYVSVAHALACKAMGIKHIRTRPYRPQTNGKAERFIRTMLREWAYAAVYGSSPERAAALSGWLERYNYRRRHGALGHRPPIQRLWELTGNNVTGIYS